MGKSDKMTTKYMLESALKKKLDNQLKYRMIEPMINGRQHEENNMIAIPMNTVVIVNRDLVEDCFGGGMDGIVIGFQRSDTPVLVRLRNGLTMAYKPMELQVKQYAK